MQTWSPHSFRADSHGAAPAYLDGLTALGSLQSNARVPVIFTLGHLAHLSDTSYKSLREIVTRTDPYRDPYETFNILKRSGGWRRICVPDPKLLRLQRWIDVFILRSPGALEQLHVASQAYAPGNSTLKNAKKHCSAGWMVKIDIKDFFESISERQVYRVFRSLNYSALLSFEMSRICTRVVPGAKRYAKKKWSTNRSMKRVPYRTTRVGHLPQGAPTSPMLANLVCKQLDTAMTAIANTYKCIYTRYADDLVFSALELTRESARAIVHQVDNELSRHAFRQNAEKTRIVSPGARKIVTGIVVNEAQPRLPRQLKDTIRAHLYYSQRFGIAEHCKAKGFSSTLGFLNHLAGLIRYARSVEPLFAEMAEAKFAILSADFPVPSMLYRSN